MGRGSSVLIHNVTRDARGIEGSKQGEQRLASSAVPQQSKPVLTELGDGFETSLSQT